MTATATIQGSEQQEDFFAELEYGDRHAILEARAGTGKSFSCRVGMGRLPKGTRSQYVAFNKSIAADFGRDLPPGASAATLHSIGFAAIKDAKEGVRLDKEKVKKIVEQLRPKLDWKAKRATARLVGLCKGELLGRLDSRGIGELADRHALDFGKRSDDRIEAIATVPEVLDRCAADTISVDFDDMIWLPVVHGFRPTSSDVLFVDECQDLNACQRQLASMACPDGRTVVVGDRFQSIYGFRGADSESIPNICRDLAATPRGLASLPLTITRRCPTQVVDLARRLVPDIEPMEDAIAGTIRRASEPESLDLMGPRAMVLCRTNAPLFKLAFDLIGIGKRPALRDTDLVAGITELAQQVGGDTPAAVVSRAEAYRAAEVVRMTTAGAKDSTIAGMHDRIDCLIAVIGNSPTMADVKARLDRLATQADADSIVLSSIHRAKGLEADAVFILRPELIPHPRAGQVWEAQQERNLAYVAVTRTRQTLTFIGDVPLIFG